MSSDIQLLKIFFLIAKLMDKIYTTNNNKKTYIFVYIWIYSFYAVTISH